MGCRGREGGDYKKATWGIIVVMKLYCIHVLVIILCYSFARSYYWEKVAKGYTGLISALFLSTECEATVMFKYKV